MKKLLILSLFALSVIGVNPAVNAQVQDLTNNSFGEQQTSEYQVLNDKIANDIQQLGTLTDPQAIAKKEQEIYDDRLRLGELATQPPTHNNGPSVGEQILIDQANGTKAYYKGGLNPNRKPIFNGPGLRGGADKVGATIDNAVSKERDLKKLIIDWSNFLLSIAAIMAVVALVWAGFLYITAFGDDSRMETAKKIVIWVVGGILLILGAYAIVNTVMRAAFI